MNRKKIIIAGMAVAAMLCCIDTPQGIGIGVHATENTDFQISNGILLSYKGTDANVLLPSSVTEIGSQAFQDNTTLKSVTIPYNVTKIDYRAFSGCSNLERVDIPDSVTAVGPGAFYACTNLQDFTIGEGVSSWGSGVLAGCSKLQSVRIDSDNKYLTYYGGALYNGDMTMLYQLFAGREGDNYVMPETVKYIDTYAFWQCENVKNVSVSGAVKTIPEYSMTNMKSVENIVLPTSVTTISLKAFADNEALKQVVMPPSVSSIHDTAFDNCPNVKILTQTNTEAEFYAIKHKIPCITEAEYPTEFKDSKEEELLPEEIKTSGESVQEAIDKRTEEAKKEVEENTQETALEETTNPLATPEKEDVLGKTVIVNGKAVVLLDNHKAKVYGVKSNEEETESAEEEESDSVSVNADTQQEASATEEEQEEEQEQKKQVPERAYYQNKNLTRYSFEDGIEQIGKLAFARTGLMNIVIPDGVEYIGYGAFYDCKNLRKITIPGSVKTIEAKAFSKTKWLDNWLHSTTEKDDFLIVGDGILLAYKGDKKEVVVPDNVKTIGAEAFAGHKEIESIYVPGSVKKIGAKAFKGCEALKGLKDCRGLETIVTSAFDDTNLTVEKYLMK